MKDKIEQLYISAIQGEWDSEYFAERMMDLHNLEVDSLNHKIKMLSL